MAKELNIPDDRLEHMPLPRFYQVIAVAEDLLDEYERIARERD